MSKLSDRTAIGGARRTFETTRWSQIARARTDNVDERTPIVDNLIRAYWKPVYCYLRQRGYSNEHAKDLTQGFFHEIVLGRDLIRRADRARGRFRTFLLTALNRYVSNEHRRETAMKRTATSQVGELDPRQLADMPLGEVMGTPEQAFNYAWAAAVLDEVLAEVRQVLHETGKETHWEVFRERVLAPILDDVKPPSITGLCKKYGIASETQASNMIATVKRRFQAVLHRRLRQFISEDSTVDAEFRELLAALSIDGSP